MTTLIVAAAALVVAVLVLRTRPVKWMLGRSYNLIRDRMLPGLPDLGGAGSERAQGSGATDLNRNPETAPIVRRGKVTAQEQLAAIQDGRYGDLMFFGRFLDGFHTLILAKTRGGKSQALLMAFLAWCYLARPMVNTITLDPKAEFYEEHRHRGGKHYLYSALAIHADEEVSAINVIPDATSAESLIQSLTSDDSGFFKRAAIEVFGHLCRINGYRSVVEVYELLFDPEEIERLSQTDHKLHAVIHGENEKRIDDVMTTLRTALSLLENPLVRRIFDSAEAEQPNMAEGSCHCYIGIDIDDEEFAQAFSPWAAALIARLNKLASNCGQDTFEVLDELASFMDVKNVHGYLAKSAGGGIRVIVSVQDLAQMMERVGENATRSAVNNASYRIIGDIDEEKTAALLSNLSGEVELERLEENRQDDAGTFAGSDRDGRRYRRITRNRLTKSNATQLRPEEYYLDGGQRFPIEHLQPELYYTFKDKLPNGYPEDKRGVPPDRSRGIEARQHQQQRIEPTPVDSEGFIPDENSPEYRTDEPGQEVYIGNLLEEEPSDAPASKDQGGNSPVQTPPCRNCGAPVSLQDRHAKKCGDCGEEP